MATGFQRVLFSSAFRQERARTGLKQRDIAAALKVAPSTVAQWESGTSAPRERLTDALEQLLGTERGAFRAMLGYSARDGEGPHVWTFAEVVENEPNLTRQQRRILNLLFDDMTANTRKAAERGELPDEDDEDETARQQAEDEALYGEHPDDRAARLEAEYEQRQQAQEEADNAAAQL